MIHGLSPAQDTQAHSLRPDYPVCRDRIIRSDAGGRIIRAGLLEKSGPGTESCEREVFEGSPGRPDYPGRIIGKIRARYRELREGGLRGAG